MVEQILVVFHPNFGCSDAVGQSFAAGVRRLVGENVAHVGAWVDLQAAPTLPDLTTP